MACPISDASSSCEPLVHPVGVCTMHLLHTRKPVSLHKTCPRIRSELTSYSFNPDVPLCVWDMLGTRHSSPPACASSGLASMPQPCAQHLDAQIHAGRFRAPFLPFLQEYKQERLCHLVPLHPHSPDVSYQLVSIPSRPIHLTCIECFEGQRSSVAVAFGPSIGPYMTGCIVGTLNRRTLRYSGPPRRFR